MKAANQNWGRSAGVGVSEGVGYFLLYCRGWGNICAVEKAGHGTNSPVQRGWPLITLSNTLTHDR